MKSSLARAGILVLLCMLLFLVGGTSAQTGVGLAGMRERLNELNGNLEIESDSHGTSLRAIVPLPTTARFAQPGDCGQVALFAYADAAS